MKLEQLNEGLIKLPEKMLEGMVQYAAKTWFGYYYHYIEDNLIGKEYHDAHELMKRALPKYGVTLEQVDEFKTKYFEKTANPMMVKSFDVTLEDLPPAYVKKLIPDVYKTPSDFFSDMGPYNIRFFIDFSTRSGDTGGRWSPKPENKLTIFIRGLNMTDVNLGSEQGREDSVNTRFPRMVGTIRHELTHAVQFIMLRHFHEKQIEQKFEGAPSQNLEAYIDSHVEFDPMIKTAVSVFDTIAKKMRQIEPEWDEFEAFRFFTCSDGTAQPSEKDLYRIGFTKRNKFFSILKKVSPTKWKKAVKLFYQEISK